MPKLENDRKIEQFVKFYPCPKFFYGRLGRDFASISRAQRVL